MRAGRGQAEDLCVDAMLSQHAFAIRDIAMSAHRNVVVAGIVKDRIAFNIDCDAHAARSRSKRIEVSLRVEVIVEVDDPHQSSVTVKYTATGARISHATKAKTGIVSSGR